MDVIIGASIASLVMYTTLKWNKSDKEKIRLTFRNLNYKVKDREPKLIKIRKTNNYTLYRYHVPYGLVDDEKLIVLEKVLNKPIGLSFEEGKLNIKVYNNKLPERINYNWIPTNKWTIPIGQTLDGMIYQDFDEIPHMTIAGMTRQGKTVLLKLIFAHLINSHKNNVEFTIIDLKGGLEFNRYRNFKQVKSLTSDVNEAYTALTLLLNELKGDMSQFKRNGYTNIVETPIKTRKFIIVDEGAELAPPPFLTKDEKRTYLYCQYALSEIARIGGALGYRLIFASQYPTSETLPRQVKQNADVKISFRLPTEIASRVAIDENGAERLGVVGRAIHRTADRNVVQVPYVTDKEIMERLDEYANSNNEEKPKTREDYVEFG